MKKIICRMHPKYKGKKYPTREDKFENSCKCVGYFMTTKTEELKKYLIKFRKLIKNEI